MKITNKKTLNLMRKILYSRQLFHHSNLCETYIKFVKLYAKNSNNITPDDLHSAQKKYAHNLSLASKGNLNFLYSSDHDITNNTFSDSYTRREIELFKLYQYHALKLSQYKSADKYLQNAINIDTTTGQSTVSDIAIKNYFDFMHTDLEIENPSHPEYPQIKGIKQLSTSSLLDKTISSHSYKWLGAKFCAESKNSINTIKSIDSNYLPENFSFDNIFSPKAFGANISGVNKTHSKVYTIKSII